ncbi:MAG: universal stress protein [Candidatus Tectomicrobia bacterium]|nr:universal stress protein [Candidatus Tectomicrobia bacterium]
MKAVESQIKTIAIKRILTPVDLSPLSEKALVYATTLAKALEAELIVLHILPMDELFKAQSAAEIGSQVQEASRRIEALLTKEMRETIMTDTVVIHGNTPAEEIIREAQERQIDMIVMGTHGRTGLKHLLMGSVAEAVVRAAPCPVTCVRDDGV